RSLVPDQLHAGGVLHQLSAERPIWVRLPGNRDRVPSRQVGCAPVAPVSSVAGYPIGMGKRRRPAQPPVPEHKPRIHPAWICLALVCLNLLIYAQVGSHEFLNWDDPEYVASNPYIAGGLTSQGVSWALTTGHAANWHPLTWMSHMLDVQLFGLTAGPHHLTNVVFHIANTI